MQINRQIRATLLGMFLQMAADRAGAMAAKSVTTTSGGRQLAEVPP